MRPLLPGPVYEATGVDADGRHTRERTIAPCGCWKGWVYRGVPTFDPQSGAPHLNPDGSFAMGEGWDLMQVACETHAGLFAVQSLRLAEQMNGRASLPPHARKFLEEHADRLIAEARELDAALQLQGAAHVVPALHPRRPED